MARLFLAVWPPPDVVAGLAGLPRKDQPVVRFVRPENWHITLRFLGDADPVEVVHALDGTALAPARAHLGPAVDVVAERLVVVPVTGVDGLAGTVTGPTAAIGKPPRRRFSGHLTLARLTRHVRMPGLLGARFDADFDVQEIALVESHLDPHGARYETLHRWAVG